MGEISIDAASVSDPVLIRGDGQVLYTLASVVDDTEMGVTHVVRGSDHVTNTATQIQIIEALGGARPEFAHHSLLTGPQGEALSKRLGTLSLRDLREAGVQPMALLSHMARLGSSDPAVLCGSIEELVEGFDIAHFGAAPTKFDVEDLYPLTGRYLAGCSYRGRGAGCWQLVCRRNWRRNSGQQSGKTSPRSKTCPAGGRSFPKVPKPDVAEEDAAFVETALSMLGDPPYSAETWGRLDRRR